jgi:hypothetical protein
MLNTCRLVEFSGRRKYMDDSGGRWSTYPTWERDVGELSNAIGGAKVFETSGSRGLFCLFVGRLFVPRGGGGATNLLDSGLSSRSNRP